MNSEHSNIAVLQQFNPANISASSGIIAEDAICHYFNPKLPDMQGDYLGRQGFMEFFGKIAGQTKGTFKVNPLSMTTMGNELVVTHVKDNITLNGQKLEIDAVVVWRGRVWQLPACAV